MVLGTVMIEHAWMESGVMVESSKGSVFAFLVWKG